MITGLVRYLNRKHVQLGNIWFSSYDIRSCIVFIWSQLDGGKVKQSKMAKVPSKRFPPKPYDAKAKPFTVSLRVASKCTKIIIKDCKQKKNLLLYNVTSNKCIMIHLPNQVTLTTQILQVEKSVS